MKQLPQIITGATNPILRAVADPITHFDKEVFELARNMKLVCMQSDGVGLAAPQVGISLRMIYITQRKKSKKKGLEYINDLIIINPEIVGKSDTTNIDLEGCLSLPGLEGKVKRYDWVKIVFKDIEGKKVTKIFKGFDARIVQHEIDHLDGILFIDKAVEMRDLKD